MEDIRRRRYHNHRLEDHSDALCEHIFQDLKKFCTSLSNDFDEGRTRYWLNQKAPGSRERKIDLLLAEPKMGESKYDPSKLRLCIENKSVITAHRNKDARFDDLDESMQRIYRASPKAITIATVLIGTAIRVLNIPDGV